MSPKKKKRPAAAQQLIDDLLDDKNSSPKADLRPANLTINVDDGPVLLNLDDTDALSIESSPDHRLTSAQETSPIELSRGPVDLSLESGDGEEHTLRIQTPEDTYQASSRAKPSLAPETRSVDRGGATEIRQNPKPYIAPKPSGSPVFQASEANLKQSESLRIAQGRISELEQELERVRRDNENLATAGDTLRRRTDELISKAENLEIQGRESQRIAEEERKVLRSQLQAKDRESAELRTRIEEIELRLESNFKKIRVRERELEHRLEIVKMESATLISTKDKMLLDLKRQIDQLLNENDHAKNKTQEVFNQYKEKQETIRRVVRALRIALTILEGDDESVVPYKKAE